MAELTIDNTYATAMYDVARELDIVEKVKDDLVWLDEIIENNEDLKTFINYPTISANQKKNLIEDIFSGEVVEEVLYFVEILIDKGRTNHFSKIVKEYINISKKQEGFSHGKVFSVVYLDDDRIKALEEGVSKLLGVNAVFENEIDESLIGGFKILIDGRIIDSSVKSKLETLENKIISS